MERDETGSRTDRALLAKLYAAARFYAEYECSDHDETVAILEGCEALARLTATLDEPPASLRGAQQRLGLKVAYGATPRSVVIPAALLTEVREVLVRARLCESAATDNTAWRDHIAAIDALLAKLPGEEAPR